MRSTALKDTVSVGFSCIRRDSCLNNKYSHCKGSAMHHDRCSQHYSAHPKRKMNLQFISSLHIYSKTKQAQTSPTVCLQCADRGGNYVCDLLRPLPPALFTLIITCGARTRKALLTIGLPHTSPAPPPGQEAAARDVSLPVVAAGQTARGRGNNRRQIIKKI